MIYARSSGLPALQCRRPPGLSRCIDEFVVAKEWPRAHRQGASDIASPSEGSELGLEGDIKPMFGTKDRDSMLQGWSCSTTGSSSSASLGWTGSPGPRSSLVSLWTRAALMAPTGTRVSDQTGARDTRDRARRLKKQHTFVSECGEA